MNWDQIEGKWGQLKGKAKEKWGRLSEDDLEVIKGKRDQLVGKLRELYGLAKEEAERQVAEFGRTAGTAVRGASQKAQNSGRGALLAAKKVGRAAVGRALDAASAGLDKVRGLVTPRSITGRSRGAASKTRTRPTPSRRSKPKQPRKR